MEVVTSKNEEDPRWRCYCVTSATTKPVSGSTSSRRPATTTYRYERTAGTCVTSAGGSGESRVLCGTRVPTA